MCLCSLHDFHFRYIHFTIPLAFCFICFATIFPRADTLQISCAVKQSFEFFPCLLYRVLSFVDLCAALNAVSKSRAKNPICRERRVEPPQQLERERERVKKRERERERD